MCMSKPKDRLGFRLTPEERRNLLQRRAAHDVARELREIRWELMRHELLHHERSR